MVERRDVPPPRRAGRGAGRAVAVGRPSSSGGPPPGPWRPRSATQTTGNSRPLARWIVISRTASRPSHSSAASPSRAPGEVLRDGVGEEAAQVAALGALVLARQPHQLAQVREPPLAAGAGEHGEVVARGGDRALEQHLERQRARRALALGGDQQRAPSVRRPRRLQRRPQRCRALAPAARASADELVGARRPRTARRARRAAPPRRAGWRARAGTRGRRGPAPGTSSRGRRRRRSAGPAPRAPARAGAARPRRGRARRCRPARRPPSTSARRRSGDAARLGAPPRLLAAGTSRPSPGSVVPAVAVSVSSSSTAAAPARRRGPGSNSRSARRVRRGGRAARRRSGAKPLAEDRARRPR